MKQPAEENPPLNGCLFHVAIAVQKLVIDNKIFY